MDINALEIAGLSVAERLDLIDRLWASIEEDWGTPPNSLSTEALMEELERRLEAHRRDPTASVPWEDVLAELNKEIDRHRK
ncbi:MAG: addiction module protein [Alphaproteobacteria bacterium]|nr:addiction module protein [Alphaproteobacteria bacterium]